MIFFPSGWLWMSFSCSCIGLQIWGMSRLSKPWKFLCQWHRRKLSMFQLSLGEFFVRFFWGRSVGFWKWCKTVADGGSLLLPEWYGETPRYLSSPLIDGCTGCGAGAYFPPTRRGLPWWSGKGASGMNLPDSQHGTSGAFGSASANDWRVTCHKQILNR